MVAAVLLVALAQVMTPGHLSGVNLAVTITVPTSSSTYDAGTASTLTLSGTAASDRPLSACTWTNSLGGSGTAAGITSWSISSAALTVGSNVFTITCVANDGTSGNDVLTVTRSAGFACAQTAGTGTVRTVGAGKTHLTVAACAAVAVAGDTCDTYTGSYGGFTAPSGSSGNPVTFQAHSGETVTMTGSATVSSKSWVLIKNYNWSGAGVLYAPDGSPASHIDLCGGTVTTAHTAGSGFSAAIILYGDNNVVENMRIDHTGVDLDFIDHGGANDVYRDLTLVNADGTGVGGEPHIDGFQALGNVTPVPSFSLFEHIVEMHCINDTGNCHFMQIRSAVGFPSDTIIVRGSYVSDVDSGGVGLQGTEGGTPNGRVYQNTFNIPAGSSDINGNDVSMVTGGGKIINNISYNPTRSDGSPFQNGGSGSQNSNIYYKASTPSATWGSPATGEATFSTLKNLNPMLVDSTLGCDLQAGSPARNAGVDLTTVAAGDAGSGTSLKLTDIRFFQPGWGGVPGDWIRVGALTTSPTTQITGIDYATGIATISPAIARSVADPVNLYKWTNGTVILTTVHPTIGGCP